MKQETIDRLLKLAIEAFANSASPDAFAKAAAHEAAFSAAHVYCHESADAASLIAAVSLLIAGILAIVCGTFGVLGLPFIPTVAAGSVATVCGAGLFIGGFFAHRKSQQINDANQQYEDMNINGAHPL